ncbi:hypothetical protein JCM10212_002882 [Sporobolomyces blumeae]
MTDKMEQAFLDGTHPALVRDADAMATLRSGSPPARRQSFEPRSGRSSRSRSSSSSSNGSEPRFSAVDLEPPSSRDPAPLRTGGKGSSNTGVKGVQADYREFLDEKHGATRASKTLAKEMGKKLMISLDDDDDDGETQGLDEEKAALERYRQQRIREMQGSGERGVHSTGDERKVFGHLREIGIEQFLPAVEGEHEDVAVVLHLYEPDLVPCILLNTHLSSLARQYPHTKFLRSPASELDFMSSDPDDDTLPTVLVYRGGDLETTWVRFDLELDRAQGGLEGRDARRLVEELLLSKGAVERSSTTIDGRFDSSQRQRTLGALSRPVDDLDDDE